jgi:hypothetical protein
MQDAASVIPVERIAAQIYLIREESVMLDSDLAALYGVTTGRLNEQAKRTRRRFPDDFAFQLTTEEFDALISQIAISKRGRFLPNRAWRCCLPFCTAIAPRTST